MYNIFKFDIPIINFKVIYALNTKNDEHEHIVKSLQQQHDKEKSQLLKEMKLKIDGLQSKLGK